MKIVSRNSNKTAFSLVEVSITLLIIGVIIAGTIKASSLYSKHKMKVAANMTNASPVNSIEGLMVWYETTLEDSFDDEEAQNYDDLSSAERTLGMGFIQTWYDNASRGTRKNATQSLLADRPQFHLNCINDLPCLRFDGSTDYLDILSTDVNLDGSEYSIFIVDKKDSTGTFPYLLLGPKSISTSGGAIAVGYESYSEILYSHGDTTDYYTIKSLVDSSDKATLHSFIGAFDNSLLSTYVSHRLYDSSSASTLTDVGTPAFTSLSGSSLFRIGSGYNESTETFYQGDIGEIIIFNRALKAGERKSVETYLMDKWNLRS